MSGSRQYDVHIDLATDGVTPWCDCPYDGPGACKHVVAVLLRCVDDLPPDNSDRPDAALNGADADDLRAFLRDELATDADLRDRFLAHVGEPTSQSADELRASIDKRFEETNPEYHVVFEPIDFTQWFDLANEYRDQGRYASAATVYRALVESLDDNMERVDGAYDHFSRAFSQALDGYVDCVATADHDADATDAVAFLEEWVTAGTPSSRTTSRRQQSSFERSWASSPMNSCVALDDARTFDDHENSFVARSATSISCSRAASTSA